MYKLLLLSILFSCINVNKNHELLIRNLNNDALKNYLYEDYGVDVHNRCGIVNNIKFNSEGENVNIDIYINCDRYDGDISYERPLAKHNNTYDMYSSTFIYNNESYPLSYFDSLLDSIKMSENNKIIDIFVVGGNNNVNDKWKTIITKSVKYPFCNFIFEFRNEMYFESIKKRAEEDMKFHQR